MQKKLKVEIVPDRISGKTTVLIWEGVVVVSNKVYDHLIEDNNKEREKIVKEYQKDV